jgi:hypothetical protein
LAASSSCAACPSGGGAREGPWGRAAQTGRCRGRWNVAAPSAPAAPAAAAQASDPCSPSAAKPAM